MQSNLFLVHRTYDEKNAHMIRLNLGDSVVGRSKWLDIPHLVKVSRENTPCSLWMREESSSETWAAATGLS